MKLYMGLEWTRGAVSEGFRMGLKQRGVNTTNVSCFVLRGVRVA